MASPDDIYKGGSSLLIRGVLFDGKNTDIYISEDGTIGATGKEECRELGEPEFIIDGSDYIASPGFVNTHTHAAMTLLRGYADDMHLQEWLSEKIWPLEAHLTGDDVYWGTKLACMEMIKSGTVAFNDMYFFMEDAARAVDECGCRAVFGHGFIDLGDEEKQELEISKTRELVGHIKSLDNPRIQASVAPHAPYTVSTDGLEWCAEYSKEQEIMLHIHLSETEGEVQGCIEQHGMRPPALLDKCGCLSELTLAAHCCWLDESECRLLGERKVSVSHNPVSNMKLAVNRAMPYQWLKDAGANITLGTDGCSSNNNLDILENLKTATLLQKFYWNSDTLLPVHEAIDMATSSGAKALRTGTGRIETGAPADIVLLKKTEPCMTPLYNPLSNIVYSCSANAVDTVICAGRVLMHEGAIPGMEEVCIKAAEVAADLVRRKEEESG